MIVVDLVAKKRSVERGYLSEKQTTLQRQKADSLLFLSALFFTW